MGSNTGNTDERLELIHDQIRDNLAGNVIPFWADHTWDDVHGGFFTRLDRYGNRIDAGEKILIMQVRMIGALAWAHHAGLRDRGYLELADRGFEFLVEHFRDHDEGGFFFSVDRAGAPLMCRKNTDAHAYAMIGLCAYHQASGNPAAREFAEHIFDILDSRARDGEYGYVEDFDGRQWEVLNAEQMHLSGVGIKTIDMHTNVMEGFSYLAEITGDIRHRRALSWVMDLNMTRGLDPAGGATITAFDERWVPVTDAYGRMTTSYGINVELAWLVLRSLRVLGDSTDRHRGKVLGLLDHALEFGFDHERGGLAAFGPMTGEVESASELPADRLLRAWWVQAELLNALADAFDLTGDERYLEVFIRQWEWIWGYQIDHEHGDWYQDIDPATLKPITTDKGAEWKTAFHVTRALIRSARFLDRILDRRPGRDMCAGFSP
ncbi:MAG: hypothetical protein EA427_17210 [Spirochaetaceae bacterium]|nr:MAG: hypothetical protein EA427_17210 [Spirochaetaceae bacterium]